MYNTMRMQMVQDGYLEKCVSRKIRMREKEVPDFLIQ